MTKKQLKEMIKVCILEAHLNESTIEFTAAQKKALESYKKTAYVVSGYETSTGVIYLTKKVDGSTIKIDKNGHTSWPDRSR